MNPGNELFPIEGKFTKSRLESKFPYLLDCYSEMYVWMGKQTTPKVQSDAMKKAMEMFQQNKTRPPWSTLKKVKRQTRNIATVLLTITIIGERGKGGRPVSREIQCVG